jgi:hypothetical protein
VRFSQFFQEIGFGLLLMLSILLMPQGVAGLVSSFVARWRSAG